MKTETDNSVQDQNATCDNNVLSDGTFHINQVSFKHYVLIENQEQWEKVKNYLHEKPNKIPFIPTYLKHQAFCSMGIYLNYSNNTSFGFGSDEHILKQEPLKEIMFNQLRF